MSHWWRYITIQSTTNNRTNKIYLLSFGKTFEKQIKTIKDQGKKQVDTLETLKLKEQTKPIKDKSNNQPKLKAIFNDLINKKKKEIN